MTEYKVETPEERRDRYFRLARAAAEAAEKTPTPEARAMYLELAVSWSEMAEGKGGEGAAPPHHTAQATPPRTSLNPKLSQAR